MNADSPNAIAPRRYRRWHQFGLRSLLAVSTLACIPLSWFGWQRHLARVRVADEADAREVVFRDMLADSLGDRFERFLAFDLGDFPQRPPADPPANYIARFNDLGVRIRAASCARLPRAGELGANGLYRGVEDPATGDGGSIFSVTIIGWTDDHTIEVLADEYSAPLWGHGYRAIVEKRDGGWKIAKKFDEFES